MIDISQFSKDLKELAETNVNKTLSDNIQPAIEKTEPDDTHYTRKDLREWLSVYETLIGEEYRPISRQTIFNDASGLLGREYLQHLKTRNLEEAVACISGSANYRN